MDRSRLLEKEQRTKILHERRRKISNLSQKQPNLWKRREKGLRPPGRSGSEWALVPGEEPKTRSEINYRSKETNRQGSNTEWKGRRMTKAFLLTRRPAKKQKNPRSPAGSKGSLGLREFSMEWEKRIQENFKQTVNLLSRGEIWDFMEEGQGESKSRLFRLKGTPNQRKGRSSTPPPQEPLKGRIPREETN